MTKWRVSFKSHSLGFRTYHVESSDKGSAYFTKVALENSNWFVIGIEELEDGDDD